MVAAFSGGARVNFTCCSLKMRFGSSRGLGDMLPPLHSNSCQPCGARNSANLMVKRPKLLVKPFTKNKLGGAVYFKSQYFLVALRSDGLTMNCQSFYRKNMFSENVPHHGKYSDINSDILADKYSAILSDILSAVYSAMRSNILSAISSGQVFWHSLRHFFWQSIWHFIWHTFSDVASGISSESLSGIWPGILSHKYSDILSGIYSDMAFGILSDIHLAFYLAFYPAFYLIFDLAFYLT